KSITAPPPVDCQRLPKTGPEGAMFYDFSASQIRPAVVFCITASCWCNRNIARPAIEGSNFTPAGGTPNDSNEANCHEIRRHLCRGHHRLSKCHLDCRAGRRL